MKINSLRQTSGSAGGHLTRGGRLPLKDCAFNVMEILHAQVLKLVIYRCATIINCSSDKSHEYQTNLESYQSHFYSVD